MVDWFASEPHFADHIAPIYRAFPPEQRGRFYVLDRIAGHVGSLGIKTTSVSSMNDGPLTVVASYGDLKKVRNQGRLAVLSEHGAGQFYKGTNSGSYVGAPDRGNVVGVLVPGRLAKKRHETTHPTIPAYAVGVPKLDARHANPTKPGTGKIAVSFHWDCRLTPETRSSFRYYKFRLADLVNEFDVIGHAHPRLARSVVRPYRSLGIPFFRSFDAVMDAADVYVVDNSSTLFEFASLDRPVVVLNAPWFRRDVEHGLRFWSHADVGVNVDKPTDLVAAVRTALDDPPEIAARRRAVVDDIYIKRDGLATERAVRAITELHRKWGKD